MTSGGDDAFFPDPAPFSSCNGGQKGLDGKDDAEITKKKNNYVHLNDVSRMSSFPNGTPVSRVFFPRTEIDVLNIIQAAHSAGKHIGIRGTKHSMG